MAAYGINPESIPPIEAESTRITVRSEYADGASRPPRQYVFVYHVTIENIGSDIIQLFWRHWLIHDPVGGPTEVQGEGVIGESPVLEPGNRHRYRSFCTLRSPTGYMEGFYHFRKANGQVFRAPVPRFYFMAPTGPLAD